MTWELLHPDMTGEALGLLPLMLSEDDPREAREQIDAHYQHGGGWRSRTNKFKFNPKTYSIATILREPDEPLRYPLARSQLRDEVILVYLYSWVVIMQPDSSYDVARID